MVLDVVVMDVSCIDMAIMGSNSVDCGCVGDLGVCIEGGHDGRMVETVAVDDDGVGVHCRGCGCPLPWLHIRRGGPGRLSGSWKVDKHDPSCEWCCRDAGFANA